MSQSNAFLYDFDLYFNGGETWQAALMQQIESITLEQALWKPSSDRHCIWDIVIHVNFWKEYMIAAFQNREKPNHETGNWSLAPGEATQEKWDEALAHTRTIQAELRSIASQMGNTIFTTDNRTVNFIRQLILHDAYHAGQIGLLRVMQGLKPVE